MRRSLRTRKFFPVHSQGRHPELVCDAPLGHGIGTVVDVEAGRNRTGLKKTFGEAFDAATGVSAPRLQKTRIRNNDPGGKAATVAGGADPGFHTWPPGHTPQNTDSQPLLRIRPHAKKTFGEAFGAATGVSDKARQHPRTASFPQSKWPNSRDRFPNSPFPNSPRTAIKRHQTKNLSKKKSSIIILII